VFVSDVAAGIAAAVRDPYVAGNTYCAVGYVFAKFCFWPIANIISIFRPKRYLLSELVDWFFRVMRKDEEWGYIRYDMRFDPLFKLKVTLNEKVCPAWPIAAMTWEKLEKVTFNIL